MSDLLSGLGLLHKLASAYGDGLKPELLALAQRDETALHNGALPLGARSASAGPVRQFSTPRQLDEAGIPVLRDMRRLLDQASSDQQTRPPGHSKK